jgi:hypothetical protein
MRRMLNVLVAVGFGLTGFATHQVATSEPAPTPPPVGVEVTPHAVPRTGEPAPREFKVPVDWCPMEDSCHVDYRSDGYWYVVEGQR